MDEEKNYYIKHKRKEFEKIIDDIANKYALIDSVRDYAKQLLHIPLHGYMRVKKVDYIFALVIFAISEVEGIPVKRALNIFEKSFKRGILDKRTIMRIIRTIGTYIGRKRTIGEYIELMGGRFGEDVVVEAKKLMEIIGINPNSFSINLSTTAGLLYLSLLKCGKKKTEVEIGKLFGISMVSVRNGIHNIIKKIGEKCEAIFYEEEKRDIKHEDKIGGQNTMIEQEQEDEA